MQSIWPQEYAHQAQACLLEISRLCSSQAAQPAANIITSSLQPVQALARDSGAYFLCVRPGSLHSKWFGDSQKLVQAVFTLAVKLQPCIIFLGAP